MALKISLPKEFLEFFDSVEQLETEYRVFLALRLYLRSKISIGKAAELSGKSYTEFEQYLRENDIKRIIGPKTVEEAESELDLLQEMTGQ